MYNVLLFLSVLVFCTFQILFFVCLFVFWRNVLKVCGLRLRRWAAGPHWCLMCR